MVMLLLDVAEYQGDLSPSDVKAAGFAAVNLKISHGLGQKSVHPHIDGWVLQARALGLGICTFHYMTADAPGARQAEYAYSRIAELGLHYGSAHQLDVESTPAPTLAEVRGYLKRMTELLGRPVVLYTGDWWWRPREWNVFDLTPYLWSAPNDGYIGSYPGDTAPAWSAGYGGWANLAVMQYAVNPLTFPDGTQGTIKVSKSAVRDPAVWPVLTGGVTMAMNPRTHPRGAPPDFTLPKPNPNPTRITNAMWWLVCMRQALEPLSENGGVLALKAGYHSYGSRLPDFGAGDSRTDHSIRRAPDRTGPWWQNYSAAHDWTFTRAHSGNFTEINLYTNRLRNAMRSPTDLRPDDVYAYTIGQIDNDSVVEGWNEYTDGDESGDSSHLWHRHDSFRRNIVGDYWAMWKALTIDMGWTYAEWLTSTRGEAADMPLDNTDKTWLKSPEFTTALATAVRDAMAKPTPLNGADGKPDGTNTYPLGRALDQGVPSAWMDNRRTPAYRLMGQTAEGVKALQAQVAAARAENAALEAGTAALVQRLVSLVTAGGGSTDAAAIVAKLDELKTELADTAREAGNEAAASVLDTLRRAAEAEASSLRRLEAAEGQPGGEST